MWARIVIRISTLSSGFQVARYENTLVLQHNSRDKKLRDGLRFANTHRHKSVSPQLQKKRPGHCRLGEGLRHAANQAIQRPRRSVGFSGVS